ncbi:HHL150Cp [Eremothecium sinecaudum]|uniref:HHL150Cp n=1 Tax=Eremothecium sinecaudum TaxID=45286 RepID=A0A120K2U0_9SACH|nr:HHL150Cp [Eremothecium sinecaudum]AMD22620.1 HHL150Cp [Eremothecium sinecaudum]
MSTKKVAIIIYTTYGHVAKLAEAERQGVISAGGSADIYLVPETLPEEALKGLHAPPKPDYPVATPDVLTSYDYFLFGMPTRFGSFPAQWKAFWDATGGLWASGALHGKFFGMFISTGTGAGNETTILNSLSVPVHHGMNFISLGYKNVAQYLSNTEVAHGGSPWGAGTLAGADGSRQPSETELKVAEIQGQTFFQTISSI